MTVSLLRMGVFGMAFFKQALQRWGMIGIIGLVAFMALQRPMRPSLAQTAISAPTATSMQPIT